MDIFKRMFRPNNTEIPHALVLPCFEWAYFTPTAELRNPAHFPLIVNDMAMELAVEALMAMAED